MKAYKIKITLEGSEPVIWRRVIVPAELTFKRLHDVIQLSMGWSNSHLYDFNIKEKKLRITGDEEAVAEYKMYSKIELTRKNDPYGFIANLLEVKPKLSSKVKIDKYLEVNRSIIYVYDLGDYWKHNIILEDIVEDYENNYPICMDGGGVCPPEDVGGVLGYMDFLEIINDKNHPEYEATKKWADSQNYKGVLNIKKINIHILDMFKPNELKNRRTYGKWVKTS